MSHVDCSSRQRLSRDFWQGAFWSEATESAICCASEAARSAADQTMGVRGRSPRKMSGFYINFILEYTCEV